MKQYQLEGTQLAIELVDLYGIPAHQMFRDDREALISLEVARIMRGGKSRVFPSATYDRHEVKGSVNLCELHVLTIPTPKQVVEVIATSCSSEARNIRQSMYEAACNLVMFQLEDIEEIPSRGLQHAGGYELQNLHFDGTSPARVYVSPKYSFVRA